MGKKKKEKAKANKLRKMNSASVPSYMEEEIKNRVVFGTFRMMEYYGATLFYVYDYVINKENIFDKVESKKDVYKCLSDLSLNIVYSLGVLDIEKNQIVFENEENYNNLINAIETSIGDTEMVNAEYKKVVAVILEGFKQNKISKRFRSDAE